MASYVSEELTLVWLLLISTVVASFFIQRWHLQYIPPSGAAMLLGMFCGGLVKATGLEQVLRFSPAVFFYGLLPPIVFAAGFNLKPRDFFKNLGPIALLAVAGTFISAMAFGLLTYLLVKIGIVRRSHLGTAPLIECLLYGSLISATDPVATLSIFSDMDVPPLLYNLVFGESVLNDAVAIVLFRSLEEFYSSPLTWSTLPLVCWRFIAIGAGSLAVGVGVALACAFILKRFQPAPGVEAEQDGTVYEIALVVMSSYLAYLVAESVRLSGIVALFFAGICHAHYSFYSVNPQAGITLKRFFEFAAFLSETFVFAYLGLQVANFSRGLDWGLILTGVPLVLLTRALNIFPLTKLLNMRRSIPIPWNVQIVLWACGLRGAVAYGLAVNMPQIDGELSEGIPAIESATLVIVLVSTLLFGSLTGPLLRYYGLQGVADLDVHSMGYMEVHPGVQPAAAEEAVREIQSCASDRAHSTWRSIDRAWLAPLFGGRASNQPYLYADAAGEEGELAGSPALHGHGSLTVELNQADKRPGDADRSPAQYQPPSRTGLQGVDPP